MSADGPGRVPGSYELSNITEDTNKVAPYDPPPYVPEEVRTTTDTKPRTYTSVTKHFIIASKVWIVAGVILSACLITVTVLVVVTMTSNGGSVTPLPPTTTSAPEPPVIDGQWSEWRPWSDCNATCGGGMRSRQRTCDNPEPDNGGKDCAGPNMEVEACNTFDCPNCNRTCDQGSLVDCAYCSCDGHVIFGQVISAFNQPLEGVKVYHTDQRWTPLARTDDTGFYQMLDVCGQGVTLRFELANYGPIEEVTQQINDTMYQADAMLTKYERPVFTSHPHPKGRFSGQDVTFCCNATGVPMPTKYSWYHNNYYIEGQSETDQLTLTSLTVDQSGLYSCKAHSPAGDVDSNEAVLQVKEIIENVTDTCNPVPDVDLYHTNPGCYYIDSNGERQTTLNKGKCPRNNRCINNTWSDFNKCDDGHTWCCEDIESMNVEIICPLIPPYDIKVVLQCGCVNCLVLKDTFVKGRAFGTRGGTRIPLKLANIYHKRELIGSTSSSGTFDVKLPPETQSPAVLEFEDYHYKEFLRSIKTVWFKAGTTIQQDVRLPLKPNPVRFRAGENVNVDLGGEDGLEPLVALNLSSTRLFKADGSVYDGEVNLFTNFIDPRNMESLLSAPVDFTFQRGDGEIDTLITYGAIGFSLEDENGDPLDLKGNISWIQSTNGFNIPVNEDGEPDVYLWVLDDITGKWIEVAPFHFLEGREKGLKNDDYLVIDQDIGDLPLTETETRRDTTSAINCDGRCPPGYRSGPGLTCYRDYEVEVSKPTCYARITAYTNDDYDVPFSNALVTVLTKEPGQSSYAGFKQEVTDDLGTACVLTYCGSEATVIIESAGYRLKPRPNEDDDDYEYIDNPDHMLFDVEYRDSNGPIFRAQERARCEERKGENYHFKFAPELIPAERHYGDGSTRVHHPGNWYPDLNDANRKACFLKVKIVDDRFDMKVLGQSAWSAYGTQYRGSYEASPWANPNDGQNQANKAICIEYKCSGNIYGEDSEEIPEVQTTVNLYVTQSCRGCSCNHKSTNPLLESVIDVQNNYVQFEPEPGNDYGTEYGIYMGWGPRDTMYETGLDHCRSGTTDGSSDMNPDTPFALEYECVVEDE